MPSVAVFMSIHLAQTKPLTRRIDVIASKQRVDERRDRGAAGEDDEDAEGQKDEHDRQQPILLPGSKKAEQVSEKIHESLPSLIRLLDVLARVRMIPFAHDRAAPGLER